MAETMSKSFLITSIKFSNVQFFSVLPAVMKSSTARTIPDANQSQSRCNLLTQLYNAVCKSRREEHRVIKGIIGALLGLLLDNTQNLMLHQIP